MGFPVGPSWRTVVFDYGTRFVWYTGLAQNQEVVEGGHPIARRAAVRGSYHHSQCTTGVWLKIGKSRIFLQYSLVIQKRQGG